jgi:hypothetical protein
MNIVVLYQIKVINSHEESAISVDVLAFLGTDVILAITRDGAKPIDDSGGCTLNRVPEGYRRIECIMGIFDLIERGDLRIGFRIRDCRLDTNLGRLLSGFCWIFFQIGMCTIRRVGLNILEYNYKK